MKVYFDESKHPRDEQGRFTEKQQEAAKVYDSRFASGVMGGNKTGKQVLSKAEYGSLRKEVMRKNAEQRGKVKSTNFAYTANYFYVYSTSGGDEFEVIQSFQIEGNEKLIKYMEKKYL